MDRLVSLHDRETIGAFLRRNAPLHLYALGDLMLAEAQVAAGGKAVCIAGGAQTAREFLRAGLVDEIQLHLVSKLLGDGLRLFEQLSPLALERTRVRESPGVTHIQFRVVKP